MGIDTEYPEYNLQNVPVKIVRFLDTEDRTEDIDVDVYDHTDEDEIRKAICDQYGYKEIEFEILEF